MNGVDILAMEEVAIAWAFNWTWFWIAVAVTTGIGLIIGIYGVVSDGCHWTFIPIMSLMFMIVGALLGVLTGTWRHTATEYETRYKVTISEEVSMVEFHEKYEIIETEGKIFTVREKGE